VGRYSHIGVLDSQSNRLHIAGGSDLSSYFVDAWSFDLDSLVWSPEAPIPQATHRATATSTQKGQALVFGGTTWEGQESDDLFEWDLASGSWNLVPPTLRPSPRYKHASAWDGSKLWIMGGRENDGESPIILDDLWSQESRQAWQSHGMVDGPGPLFRQGMTWDPVHQGLWVYGGINADGERSDRLHFFEVSTETWTEVVPTGIRPLQKASHSMVYANDGLIVWGGHATDTASWHFDIGTETWAERDSQLAPSPRDAQVTARSEDGKTLYIMGGDNFEPDAEQDVLSDVWSMDTESGAWTLLKATGYGVP
jgi:hypothetical protein